MNAQAETFGLGGLSSLSPKLPDLPKPKVAHAVSEGYYEQFANPGMARILLDPDYSDHSHTTETAPPERESLSPLPSISPRDEAPRVR